MDLVTHSRFPSLSCFTTSIPSSLFPRSLSYVTVSSLVPSLILFLISLFHFLPFLFRHVFLISFAPSHSSFAIYVSSFLFHHYCLFSPFPFSPSYFTNSPCLLHSLPLLCHLLFSASLPFSSFVRHRASVKLMTQGSSCTIPSFFSTSFVNFLL